MRLFPQASCYILLLAISVFDAVVLLATNISLDRPSMVSAMVPVLAVAGSIVVLRLIWGRRGADDPLKVRFTSFFQGVLFLQVSWIALRLFNHLTSRLASDIDYLDPMLIALDDVLMPFWKVYFEAFATRPELLDLMQVSYVSLTNVSIFGFLILAAGYGASRSQYFIETFFVTAVICTGFGALFPALGAVASRLPETYDFSAFPSIPGLWAVDYMEALRTGEALTLHVSRLPGLVTFPSFHTAAGIILMMSFRKTLLFVPVCAYSVVMISATPIFGGHHLVDLLAGTLVAYLVAVRFARKERFSGLFSKRAVHGEVPVLERGPLGPDNEPLCGSAVTNRFGDLAGRSAD